MMLKSVNYEQQEFFRAFTGSVQIISISILDGPDVWDGVEVLLFRCCITTNGCINCRNPEEVACGLYKVWKL